MPLIPPRTLSPSKLSAFTSCPLAFRYANIDRLPQTPHPAAVKGTFVHAALERLMWFHEPGERSPAAADAEVHAVWETFGNVEEMEALELTDTERAEFFAECRGLVRNLFDIEDPNAVRTAGVEVGLEADVSTVRLRGVIDRLDVTDEGELVVVDYKTGKSPSPAFEQNSLRGVHFYALLCQEVLGRTPVEVRLFYLRDGVVISASPNARTVNAQHVKTTAVWNAISRACTSGDFRPRRSGLCRFCSFQAHCPEFGGITLPVPVIIDSRHATRAGVSR